MAWYSHGAEGMQLVTGTAWKASFVFVCLTISACGGLAPVDIQDTAGTALVCAEPRSGGEAPLDATPPAAPQTCAALAAQLSGLDGRSRLEALCPAGAVVRYSDISDGAPRKLVEIACPVAVDILQGLGPAELQRLCEEPISTASEPLTMQCTSCGGRERDDIGVARQPWSPVGLACDVVFAVAIAYGCHRSNLDWRACLGVGGAPTLACNLL
jgi:hypothetical protein